MEIKNKMLKIGTVLKRLILVLACLAFVILLSGLGLFLYFNQAPEQANSKPADEIFVIEKGEGLADISRHLEETGHIRSALFFQLYGRILGTQNEFKSGSYKLPPSLRSTEIHDSIVSGKQILIKVTIPEGSSARQAGLHLQEAGICGVKDFQSAIISSEILGLPELDGLPSAEGFLFPDTYLFAAETPAPTVAKAMIRNFFKHIDQITPRRPDTRVLFDTLRLASIIEKEYVDPEEAPLMASVFLNRLKIGKALESCATVVYVMTEELGLPHPSRIYYRDLARKSPYNTYLHPGLPPGPISNPGHVALNAAFHPADSDYLYFVLKGQDAVRHHFSKTFAEHNQATVFYLKKQ